MESENLQGIKVNDLSNEIIEGIKSWGGLGEEEMNADKLAALTSNKATNTVLKFDDGRCYVAVAFAKKCKGTSPTEDEIDDFCATLSSIPADKTWGFLFVGGYFQLERENESQPGCMLISYPMVEAGVYNTEVAVD